MAGQCGTWRRHLTLADNALCAGVPVPQQYRTISRARCNIAIGRDVAFGARQTGDHTEMTKDDLNDFRCFGQIYTETVIPETAGNQETTVHRCDKAIGANL